MRLYVLGLPAVKGSVTVLDPKHEIPLKDAVNKIKTAITTGSLVAKFTTGGKLKYLINIVQLKKRICKCV